MAEWFQSSPWRQGFVLSQDSAEALGITGAQSKEARVVVIAHDCDLEQDPGQEPNVEAIVGKIVPKADGNFLNARSARTLHLAYNATSASQVVELRAGDKIQIAKSSLGGHRPDPGLTLKPSDKRILQNWLAARYHRAAFPNAFNERLGKKGLDIDEPLRKILSAVTGELVAVYFDLDEGEDNERDASGTYQLTIYLVSAVEPDPEKAQSVCDDAREKIEALFKTKCHTPKGWNGVELEGCYVISVAEMTLDVASKLRKWNADYLSLRRDPQAQMVG